MSELTTEDLQKAIETYQERHPDVKTKWSPEAKQWTLTDVNGIEIHVLVDSGKLVCDSDKVKTELSEIIMDNRDQEPARSPMREANVPAVPRKAGQEFDMEGWRQRQPKTYSVAGREAPNAFSVSEEANKQGLCTEIIDAGRNGGLVWGHVRVTDPKTGQYREDRVSHEKETFCLLKAWEDANSQAKYTKGLIVGVGDNNMPELNPDVRIKGMPASLWLTMQVMRSWSMADRDAITKAERRAQLKIMNREWRDEGELSLETEEEQAVRDSINSKAAGP